MSSASEIVVLGIDGGGSRTRAALVDATGCVLGYGEAGPSNIHVVGREAARDAIADAVGNASDSSGFAATHVKAAFLGLAGVSADRDRDDLRSIGRELDLAPDETLGVDHDLRIALAGGLGCDSGVVLIAGTGSSCYGRGADGSTWRAGGWGPLLDDLGSGYWLGVQSIVAITRAVDGRGPATSLRESVGDALGVDEPDELLRLTGRDGLPRERLAELAPLVLEADASGDDVAHEIVRHGIDELARMVQAVVQNLGWLSGTVPLVFTGGLATNRTYRDELELVVGKRAPNVRLVEARMSPVLGAALLALDSVGASSPDAIAELASAASHH